MKIINLVTNQQLFTPCSLILSSFSERVAGQVDDLTDLLLEDWRKLGSCREMGETTLKYVRTEMERTWGSDHLAVFEEGEAQKWLLGVRSLPNPPSPA